MYTDDISNRLMLLTNTHLLHVRNIFILQHVGDPSYVFSAHGSVCVSAALMHVAAQRQPNKNSIVCRQGEHGYTRLYRVIVFILLQQLHNVPAFSVHLFSSAAMKTPASSSCALRVLGDSFSNLKDSGSYAALIAAL